MKYFKYIVRDNEIAEAKGEVDSVPSDFIEYDTSMVGCGVYYKLAGGKLSEVIGEGFHETTAKRQVDEFISGFNVSLV